MTVVFWAMAALLAAVAVGFVLPALLGRARRLPRDSGDAANVAIYREQLRELDADLANGMLAQERYHEARRELERRMLEDVETRGDETPAASAGREAAVAVGIALPLVAALLYIAVGTPQALGPRPTNEEGQGVTPQQIEGMVERLAARLKESPDDVKGWTMLGRSYTVLERFTDAAAAYENAIKRSPADAQLLADYADVLGMAQGRNLSGAPEKIIAQALKVDPDNLKALVLAGTVAFQKGEFNNATAFWERALRNVPPDSDMAESIRDSIADARKAAGTSAAAAPTPSAPSTGSAVTGSVALAPALVAKASPDDTVFIFARPAEGSRMPLAVTRRRVRELPAAFTLDDSMAMTPASKLSSQQSVVVGARISRSGNPIAQPGDLEGYSSPIKPGASGVKVLVESEVR